MMSVFIYRTVVLLFLFMSQTVWSGPTDDSQGPTQHTPAFLVKNYSNLSGLLRYADIHSSGDVIVAYKHIASRLDEKTFKKLNWKKYEQVLNQLKEKTAFFYDKNGKLNKEALTITKQLTYANLYYHGNMTEAFRSGSTFLSDTIKKKFQWVEYPGSVEEFIEIQTVLYKGNILSPRRIPKGINPDYQDLSGQIRLANERGWDLHMTFEKAHITAPNMFTPKGWIREYTGSIRQIKELIQKLKEELDFSRNGKEKSKYERQEGQALLGKNVNINNMLMLYNYVKSIANITTSEELPYNLIYLAETLLKTWVPFDGTLQEFKEETRYFLNADGTIRNEIFTITGLAKLAEKHYEGDMTKTFDKGKVIFDAYNISMFPLLWIKVETSSSIFFQKQQRLYDTDGTLKEMYRYHEGQAKYAADWHGGDMYKGYTAVFSLLQIPVISRPTSNQPLNYQPSEIEQLANFTHTEWAIGSYIQQAVGRHLGWTEVLIVTRTSRTFYNARNTLVDKDGTVKKKWKGVLGQIEYAKKHTKGSMKDAWDIQHYVWGNKSDLNWLLILYSANTVEEIIQRFLDPNKQLKEKYTSQEGYFLYAEEYTERNLRQAYTHFTYLPLLIQKKLKWYYYNGSIEDFKRDVSILEEYQGMAGLLKFALEFHAGSIVRAYKNILAVFKGNQEELHKKTGWLIYYNYNTNLSRVNTVRLYERDKKALIVKNREINPKYKGIDGYIQFSEKYYNGDMLITYVNAKAVLETDNLLSLMRWSIFPGTTAELKSIGQFLLGPDNAKTLSSLTTPKDIETLTMKFMRINNIVYYDEKNVKEQIKAFLQLHNPPRCSSIFYTP